ncbi:MAG: hypothetical protein GY869_21085, partial [Planctomycetes bacterium]|nr:hypothetical protein [Planctomycetota bacterium]
TTVTCNIGPYALGTYNILASADSAAQLYEYNENNNSLLQSIDVSGDPDLVVESISPAIGSGNEEITLTVSVRNQGNVDSELSYTRINIDGTTYCLSQTPGIPAGEAVNVSCLAGVFPVGGYTVEACADVSNLIAESNESNNCMSQALSISFPDLVLGIEPVSSRPGDTVAIELSVTNQGGTAAVASRTRIRLDSVTVCDQLDIPALSPGETTIVSCDIGSYPVGTYQLEACADINFAVAESDESNNCTIGSLISDYLLNVPGDYQTIQDAIDAAYEGATVLVGDGTHIGTGNKNLNFKGKKITVQSENGPDHSIIDCQDSGRGLTFSSGEGTDSVVSGFTIINGSVVNGGGIQCVNSSPTITNCILRLNSATNAGGGISLTNSSPMIINCIFDRNWARYGAGGIYAYSSSPSVIGCNFTQNSCDAWGGAAHNQTNGSIPCRPVFTNCTFFQNEAPDGGGMYNRTGAAPTLINCTFTENQASNSGGGIYNTNSSQPALDNCTFIQNTAGNDGGGMYNNDGCMASLTHCIFSNNTAADKAGGLYCRANDTSSLTNCTFSRNNSAFGGGMYI